MSEHGDRDLAALHDRVERDIDERVATLRDQYGSFPVHEERVANHPDRFDTGVEMVADGWRGDAGALVTDADGRALFIRHTAHPDVWGLPGGGHEPGETHAETARREVREETGIDCEITGVIRARRRTFYDETAPDRELEMLTVWFEARPSEGTAAVADAAAVDDEEIEAVRWFETPPDAVAESLEPVLAALQGV